MDSPPDRPSPLEDPRILPFLPMVYVAWADGELTPEELDGICAKVRAQRGIDGECQECLSRWLDPHAPPTAEELRRMLTAIRRAARGRPGKRRQSLTDLGLDLLAASSRGVRPVERRALEEVEEALGLPPGEASRALLVTERPEPEPEPAPEPFPMEELTDFLDTPFRELRREVRSMMAEPPFAYRYGLSKEDYREHVLALLKELARRGYGALSFPRTCGGKGDNAAFIAVFETLAHGDLSLLVKLGVQFGLFGGSILQLGTEKHHRKYLPAVGTVELPGCFAMSESGHGSNVRDVETTATYDPATEEFEVHTPRPTARKDWIGNAAAHGRLATVFAQLRVGGEEYGVHAFLVPIRDAEGRTLPRVKIADCGLKLGLNGVDNGRLWFDRVRIPRENLLDRFAQVAADGTYTSPINSPGRRFFTMLGTLVGGRVSVALAGLSAAKNGLAIALRYGQRRRQFGPEGQPETRILDYLTHQRRLLPRLAATYALHFALRHLAEQYAESEGEDRRAVETLAAGLKAASTWHAIDTLQTCRECCGGQGYLEVNRFAALKADTDVFATFEGDNVVLLQLVAKGLLTGFRQQFGEIKVLGLVRYLASQAATTLAELNPVITRRTDEGHLKDRDFQLAAFSWREQHLLSSAARRLKKRIEGGMDSHQAMIAVQDHLMKLALAHVDRVLLERFAASLETAPEKLRPTLTDLCDLFALSRLEADRGWFLSQGYLEPAKTKAIRNLVNELVKGLRPRAVPLVDAFAIPDAVLAAPIALGNLDKPVAEDTMP